jgi:hypothetical protein
MLALVDVNPPGPVQLNEVPPLAVNVAVAPAQIAWLAGAIAQVGSGLTVNTAEQLLWQPFASVTVTL